MDKDQLMEAARDAAFRHITDAVQSWTARINIGGKDRHVLILSIGDFVGWVKFREGTAVWRHGDFASGKAVIPPTIGGLAPDFGRLSVLVLAWYLEARPSAGPLQYAAEIRAEEFVRCIEEDETPPAWAPRSVTPRVPVTATTVTSSTRTAQAAPKSVEFNPTYHTRERFPPAAGFTDKELDGVPLVTVRPAIIPACVAGFFLFVGFMGATDYSFYTALRWAVTVMAIWASVVAGGQKRAAWSVAFAAMAVLFNPLIPVYLSREQWAPLDFGGLVLFVTAAVKLRASRPATHKDGPTPITG